MKQSYYKNAVDFYNRHEVSLAKEYALKQIAVTPQDINTLKLLAFIEYQSNHFELALKYLTKAISIDENNTELNNLTGCIFLQTGEYEKSAKMFAKCIENEPDYIDAYSNLATCFQKLNQPLDTIEVCKIALSIEPASIAIISLYASTLSLIGDYFSAKNIYKSWVAIEPNSIQSNAGLAKCYLKLNQLEDVLSLLVKLKNTPDKSPFIRLDVTNELLQNGNLDEAINSYKELLEDIDEKETIFNNLATVYDHLENPEKAIHYFNKAINENNLYVPAHSNIGRVYTDINQLEKAHFHLLKALEIDPNNISSLNNIGRLYDIENDHEQAKKHFERAIQISPNNAKAHYNLGNVFHQTGDYSLSSRHYKECLSLDPHYADAEQNLGINELAMGNFGTAWGHYFKRIRNLEKGEVLSPITPGMSLTGKSVYFCRSQGIGDEIFFLRFLPKLKEQNLSITYRASRKTYSLLSQVTEIDTLLNEDDAIPKCDYYFTIDDLPLILNINNADKITAPLKLTPEPHRIIKARKLLESLPPPYTGITWRAGNQEVKQNHKNNQQKLSKTFPIEHLEKILCHPNKKTKSQIKDQVKGQTTNHNQGSIIILQRDPEENEIRQLQDLIKQPIVDLSEFNNNLDDMLALLSLVDNYVGVSNTNTHLYAALGKQGDVFVPFPPDWRWMLEGDTSPWFPGFGIFRQKSDGNWKPAITKLLSRLDK